MQTSRAGLLTALLLSLSASSQDKVSYQESSTAVSKGTKVTVTETYKTDSPKLLHDFLSEHPQVKKDGEPLKLGRNNGFTFIIQAEGNQNATLNVNLYVTLEKTFIRLTREQKRSLSMVSVQDEYVERNSQNGNTALAFNVKGVRIGENMFVRVTKSRDYTYSPEDEYYFIAPKSSVATAKGNTAQKVDPNDFNLEAGTDEELEHFGIRPPQKNDYLKLERLKAAEGPAFYPGTVREIARRNGNTLEKNLIRWNTFVAELKRKRVELGVAETSNTLKTELYIRYHPSHYSGVIATAPPFTACTPQYMKTEWQITPPDYLSLGRIVNVPADYPSGLGDFARRIGRDNTSAHQKNSEAWNEFLTKFLATGVKDPCYSQCYWEYAYDGASRAKWVDVTPQNYDIDEKPPRPSLVELRKHDIKLPEFLNQTLPPGINPYGGNFGVLSKGPNAALEQELGAINRYNKAVMKHNREEWSRFARDLQNADVPMRAYRGKRLGGVFLENPDETDFYRERRFFYRHSNAGTKLPSVDGEDFDF